MSDSKKKTGPRSSAVDPIVTSAIGRQLKKLYDDVATEPVPDRFAELLDQLAEQERQRK